MIFASCLDLENVKGGHGLGEKNSQNEKHKEENVPLSFFCCQELNFTVLHVSMMFKCKLGQHVNVVSVWLDAALSVKERFC